MLLIATGMLMMVGCGKVDEQNVQVEQNESAVNSEPTYADATSVLEAVWDKTPEKFPCYGGGATDYNENKPGKLDLSEKDFMTNALLIPSDVQENVTDAATLVHMMNSNIFTGVALKTNGMDVNEAAKKIENTFLNNHFICGMPDKIVIVSLQDYVVYAYGKKGVIDEFKGNISSLGNVNVIVDKYYE